MLTKFKKSKNKSCKDDTPYATLNGTKIRSKSERDISELFYVALTRAKEAVYLISEQGNESSFIEEIGEEHLSIQLFHSGVLTKHRYLCQHSKP